MQVISQIVEDLSASQEWLCSVDLVSLLVSEPRNCSWWCQ